MRSREWYFDVQSFTTREIKTVTTQVSAIIVSHDGRYIILFLNYTIDLQDDQKKIYTHPSTPCLTYSVYVLSQSIMQCIMGPSNLPERENYGYVNVVVFMIYKTRVITAIALSPALEIYELISNFTPHSMIAIIHAGIKVKPCYYGNKTSVPPHFPSSLNTRELCVNRQWCTCH